MDGFSNQLEHLETPCYRCSGEAVVACNPAKVPHDVDVGKRLSLSIASHLSDADVKVVPGADLDPGLEPCLLVIVPYTCSPLEDGLVFCLPHTGDDLDRLAFIKDKSGYYLYISPSFHKPEAAHYNLFSDSHMLWDDILHVRADDILAYKYGSEEYLCCHDNQPHYLRKQCLRWDGTPVALSCYIEDAPNHKLLDELDRAHGHLLSMFPGQVYWKDRFGIVRGCNKRVLRLAGFDQPEDLVGKSDYQLPWKAMMGPVVDFDKQVMTQDREITREEYGDVVEDGEIRKRWFLSTKRPLHDSQGNVIGLIGSSVDITDSKLAEKKLEESLQDAEAAQSALQFKNEFVANMNHDIRTPLAGMIGMAQMIIDSHQPEDEEDRVRAYANNIVQAGQGLLDMHNEIMELSKTERKSLDSLSEDFHLSQLTDFLSHLYQPQIIYKGLDWSFSCSESVPDHLHGARPLLQRVLLNLISNALKFTEEGKISLNIKALTSANDAEDVVTLQFSIMDTGVGIPESQQQSIFQPFTRVPAHGQRFAGSGLGLHIVEQFVHKMAGDIQVHSTEGEGTTFTLTIPFTRVGEAASQDEAMVEISAEPSQQAADSSAPKAQAGGYGPALVVEDNPMAQQVAQHMLKDVHETVDLVDNGAAAIESMQTGNYVLVYLDLGLPDINGAEVCQAVRCWEHDEGREPMPIIALTAHVDPEELERLHTIGFTEIRFKPILTALGQELAKKYLG